MERGADMLEMNSFVCGDCMDYLPHFPDNYFDIAVAGPPYGIGEHGGMKRPWFLRALQRMKVWHGFR